MWTAKGAFPFGPVLFLRVSAYGRQFEGRAIHSTVARGKRPAWLPGPLFNIFGEGLAVDLGSHGVIATTFSAFQHWDRPEIPVESLTPTSSGVQLINMGWMPTDPILEATDTPPEEWRATMTAFAEAGTSPEVTAPAIRLPLMFHFADPSNPASARWLDPSNPEEVLGAGAMVAGSACVTRETETTGRLAVAMPWIEAAQDFPLPAEWRSDDIYGHIFKGAFLRPHPSRQTYLDPLR